LNLYKLGARNEELLGCDAMSLSGKVADLVTARDMILVKSAECSESGRRRRR
jgi:hypothetical protein